MRKLNWCESTEAVVPPRIRVERFGGVTKKRVHLLDEVRCKKTHYRFGENTVPCLEPEACPFCADPTWKTRLEFFGPALMMEPKEKLWVPIVAVFTKGGWNQLTASPEGAWRGRMLEVWRQPQGTAGGGVLKVKELLRVDPVVPPFDVEPHLLRLWFPHDNHIPPAEIPAPIPYTTPTVHRRPDPEPTRVSPETVARLRDYIGRKPSEEPEPVPVVEEQPNADAVDAVMARLIPGVNAEYGPKQAVRLPITEADEIEALTKRTARVVCDTQKARSPHLNGTGKGGAK